MTITLHNERVFRELAPQLGFEPEPWMADAACQYVDPELHYPEKGGSTAPAKRICASCPVRVECLAYALDRRETWGVWGGLSERERHRLLPRKMTGVPARGLGRGGDHACLLNGCAYRGPTRNALARHRTRWHQAAA